MQRPTRPGRPWKVREVMQAVATSPTMLATDASLARLGLARDGGVLQMAVEAAQDAGAATANERMLAHQLAAAHQAVMGLFAAADSVSSGLHATCCAASAVNNCGESVSAFGPPTRRLAFASNAQ